MPYIYRATFAAHIMLRHPVLLLAALFLISSCEKEEKALVLPPAGPASHDAVDMGNDYQRQIFYDFESGQEVFTSDPASWDLAFEASDSGRHVYMNGGNNVQIYNTHESNMQAITALPSSLSNPNAVGWTQYDDPSGRPDMTGVGEWAKTDGSTKGEVYIIQTLGTPSRLYYKVRFVSVDKYRYVLEWAQLNDAGTPTSLELAKNGDFSFIYFSFKNGIVKPDPPKSTWDVVFTRYRYIYRNYLNQGYDLGYDVTGALLNPYNTTAGADSITAFESIDLAKATAMPKTTARDIIGYDWKQYDFSTTRYTVHRYKNYVLHTRKDKLFKLHFLEFYNSSGEKGSPAFEFQQLK